MLATGMPHLSTMHHKCQVCLLVSACLRESAYLLAYLLSFLLVCCLWEMPLLVGNGVACFSCMHTIRAEAGLCLLVPAMFARVMVFIICLFLFGVYRDQNTGGER